MDHAIGQGVEHIAGQGVGWRSCLRIPIGPLFTVRPIEFGNHLVQILTFCTRFTSNVSVHKLLGL